MLELVIITISINLIIRNNLITTEARRGTFQGVYTEPYTEIDQATMYFVLPFMFLCFGGCDETGVWVRGRCLQVNSSRKY